MLDQGISATYAEASLESSNQHVGLLKGLIQREWLGMEEDLVLKRLQAYVDAHAAKPIILKRDSTAGEIELEGIRFRFQDHKLVAVE